jgi:Peptidase C13 family
MNDYQQRLKDLFSNLKTSWAGMFASLAYKPAALNRIKFDLVSASFVAVFSFGLVVSLDWLMRRRDFSGRLRFDFRSLESEAIQIGAFLLCGALAAHFAQKKSPQNGSVGALLLFVLLIAAKLLTVLFELLFGTIPWAWLRFLEHEYLQLALLLWFYLFCYVTLRRGLRLQPAHAVAVLLPLLGLQAFQNRVPPHDFWQEVKTAKSIINPASEDSLEKQTNLLPTQLAAISPQRPGIHDVYFLGFSPFATEDVFKLELDSIVPLMEERFDAKNRTLRLSNHLATLDKHPFASLSNLRKALFAIATKMNLEEDVFVLYITSHGSKQHAIASRFPPFDFNEVTPQNLRAMLDASGIKNRVLIISACYSGGFIEPLKDANTLVMSAAAADRPSFGCGAESEFTYFGKAVIDEQLRKNTTSFEQAFKNAIPIIRSRETAQGFEFSDPKISVGEKISPILKALEKQLLLPR